MSQFLPPIRRMILALVLLSMTPFLPAAPLEDLQAALASEDWPKAESIAKAMIASGGENVASGWQLRSQVAMATGKSKEAVQYAEKAVKRAPDSVEAQINLGNAYVRRIEDVGMIKKMGIAKKMKTAYERALELDPKHPVALRSLIGFYSEAPGFAGGDKERAAELDRVLWTVAPIEAAMMEVSQAMSNEDYGQAQAALAKARRTHPDAPALTYQVGKLAALTGENLEEGQRLLEAYLQLPDPPDERLPSHGGAQWRLGQIFVHQEKYEEARRAFEKARTLSPELERLIQEDLDRLP